MKNIIWSNLGTILTCILLYCLVLGIVSKVRYLVLFSCFSSLFGFGLWILNIIDIESNRDVGYYTDFLPPLILTGCAIYIFVMLPLAFLLQMVSNRYWVRYWVKGIIYTFGGWITGAFIFDLFISIEMNLPQYLSRYYIVIFVSIGILYAILDIYTDKKVKVI